MAGRITRRRLLGRMATVGGGVVAARSLAARAASASDAAAWCSLDGAREGTASIGAPSVDTASAPEVAGAWSPAFRVRHSVIGVHAIVLHTGKVLLLEGRRAGVWNPEDGTARRVDPPEDLFCAGHCVLGDGRVFFAGGAKVLRPPNWTTVFDPVTETWERGPLMRQGRWYPSTTTLAGGDQVVITTGEIDRTEVTNEDIEVYSAADGTVEVVGSRRIGLYPHQKLAPDGRVVVSGPSPRDSGYIDPAGWTWTGLPWLTAAHPSGGGVLLPAGPEGPHEVMLVGGTRVSGALTESIDLHRPEDGWRARAPLPEARAHMNTVLLPDGTVLGVGGSYGQGNFHQSLLYDPVADTWAPMAAQTKVRGYHSTAVLLPDGRILSAGDNRDPGGFDFLEVYSPPYLFRGRRPVIHQAPTSVTWGEAFDVVTHRSVTRAVLLRPGATTHTNDMEQRHVELAVAVAGRTVRATAPPSPAVAPPGWYLLFVLADGVPSKAAWVRIGA